MGKLYRVDHPYYDTCTLYLIEDRGLAIIQQRFNSSLKATFWTAIDRTLDYDISRHPEFKAYLDEHAEVKDRKGLYPTVTVRQVMRALGMKPIKKHIWETRF